MTELGEGIAIGILPPIKDAEEPRSPGNLVVTLKETSSGEAIKDVKVSIAGASSGEATTNAAGQCRFDGIAAGFYTLTLTQDEFEMSPDKARFAIHPDQTLKLNIKVRRVLTTVVMKRIHVRGTLKAAGGDKSELEYGHWWVEVDGSQSFGWWPASGVSIGGTFLGVPGVLNEMKGAIRVMRSSRPPSSMANPRPTSRNPSGTSPVAFPASTAPPGAGRQNTTVTPSRSK